MDELSTLVYVSGSLVSMFLLVAMAMTGLQALGAPAKNNARIASNQGKSMSLR